MGNGTQTRRQCRGAGYRHGLRESYHHLQDSREACRSESLRRGNGSPPSPVGRQQDCRHDAIRLAQVPGTTTFLNPDSNNIATAVRTNARSSPRCGENHTHHGSETYLMVDRSFDRTLEGLVKLTYLRSFGYSLAAWAGARVWRRPLTFSSAGRRPPSRGGVS